MSKFSPLRLISKKDASHEDAFLARHDVLFRHALKLTRGNRELAEDLLQDAFVYFTQLKPELDEIQNLDAYLYTILKNLQAAYLRKGMRDPLGDLAAMDYESAELGLRASPASRRLVICDQLVRICEYAFSRREQSRPHCLLLLRFFHNYYMDELVLLAGNSYPTVRKWLDEAQADVHQALSVTAAGDSAQRFEWTKQIAFFSKPEEFLRSLRELLLVSGQDSCPSQRTLRSVFSGTSLQETPTEMLAHLTGCRECLDRVNELLGLPHLAYRYMEDMGERGRGPKDGSGPTSGTPGGAAPFDLRRARRKIESVTHHEPKRLLILVNGEERAAHDIAQDRNRFVSKFSAREEVNIVEVVSEQDVCLLTFMLHEDPAAEPLEWRRSLEMSGGRTLEATLRYADNWPSIEVSYHDPRLGPSKAIASEVEMEKPLPEAGGIRSRWRKLLEKFEKIMISGLNPLLTSAAILGVASILCLFVWWHNSSRIAPEALLKRAEAGELGMAAKAEPGVIYQKVRIRTRKRTLERDIYRDVQELRQPREQHLDQETSELRTRLAVAGVSWDRPLAASNYKDWQDHEHVVRETVKRSGDHLLTLTTAVDDGLVAQESLTVRDSDFHPVERTVVFRDTGAVEIAELNYTVLPWNAINQDWFEPISDSGIGSLGTGTGPRSVRTMRIPLPPSTAELDEAELEAMLALLQLHADASERLQVVRHSANVEVSGIVETERRKREIESHLSGLRFVTPAISTFEEMQRRPGDGTAITRITASSDVEQPTPLENYLLKRGLSHDEIGDISHRLFNASIAVHRESIALDDLFRQFNSGEKLTETARRAFDELVAEHRARLLAALLNEDQLLNNLGLSPENHPATSIAPGLAAATERNAALCNELLSGNDGKTRSAQLIVPEIEDSIGELRMAVSHLPLLPNSSQSASTPPRSTNHQQ